MPGLSLIQQHGKVVLTLVYSDDAAEKKTIPLADLRQLQGEFVKSLEVEQSLGISVRDHDRRSGKFIEWLIAQQVETVGPKDWLEYYAQLKQREKAQELSPTTVRNYLQSLRKFAVWLVEKEHMSINPVAGITSPKPVQKTIESKAITQEAMQLMIDQADSLRDEAIFLFFRDTGCRKAEAGRLTWDDIDLEKLEVNLIGKRGKPRTGYLKKDTAEVLLNYWQELTPEQRSGLVWWGKYGPLTPDGIYQIFRRTAKGMGKPIKRFNPHAWRHAFGKEATARGMPTAVLQTLLGHENIETTTIYTSVDQDLARKSYQQYFAV